MRTRGEDEVGAAVGERERGGGAGVRRRVQLGGRGRGAQSLARLPFHYWLIMSLKPLRTSPCALFAHVVFCGVCVCVFLCVFELK